MTTPTIQEITDSAWHKIAKYGKGAHQYKLLVWQQHATSLNTMQHALALWHIEYQGVSFQQPFVTVSGVTPEGALKRFEEELQLFDPITLAELEELVKHE